MQPLTDQFVSLLIPDLLQAVGNWYQNFSQTEDAEVIDLLNKSRR